MRLRLVPLALAVTMPPALYASVGTEAASFLEIPVGARAAALGGAYSALASDAYAPVYNAAGLGFADSVQLAAQHLSYVESIHYEVVSAALPLHEGRAVGASVQYLGSGDITQTNDAGARIGEFDSHYAAYALSYGQRLTDRLSLGATAKWINAAISDLNANAYAADAGVLFRVSSKLTLAGVVANAGSRVTFLEDGGSLPLQGRMAGSWEPNPRWQLTGEFIARAYGLLSGHGGVEWRPSPMTSLRVGYRSDTTPKLGALAGFTTGIGLNLWGQELSYAWVPLGDLGSTHYISLLLRLGETKRAQRNLIHYQSIKRHRIADAYDYAGEDSLVADGDQILRLLADDERRRLTAEGGAR